MHLRSSSRRQRSGPSLATSLQDGNRPSSKGNAVRALLVPVLVAAALWCVVPAGAAPSNTAIVAVYECPSGACGSNADQLSSGDITHGLLRFDVRADDNLGGLRSLLLEAIGPTTRSGRASVS